MMTLDVNLILIGKDCWAALLASGSVLLESTSSPKADCAHALLRMGMDPRTTLRIRAGSKVIAHDLLGSMGGSPVVCNDLGAVERD